VLAAIIGVQVTTAMAILLLKPPGEPNDEIDHVRNIQTIAEGHAYEMKPGSGLEANQPPLYYVLVAGWQRMLGVEPKVPVAVPNRDCQVRNLQGERPACWLLRHDTVDEAENKRLVRLLRVPSVLLAVATTLFTAAAARRLGRSRWTPVVAAGVVVGVTRFEFVSAAVTNDMLVNALAAAGTYLAVAAATASGRQGLPSLRNSSGGQKSSVAVPAALGVVVAGLLLTKLTGTLLIPGLVLAAALSGHNRREALRAVAVLVVVSLALSGWWLLRNLDQHGDPLAVAATADYLRNEVPFVFASVPAAERAFERVPNELWSGFWYASYHVRWSWWVYLLFWTLTLGGVVGVVVPGKRSGPGTPRAAIAVLGVLAIGGLAGLWIIGLQTIAAQARHVYPALPAIACLVALGLERVRVPVAARFVLPVLGMVASWAVIVSDVVNISD